MWKRSTYTLLLSLLLRFDVAVRSQVTNNAIDCILDDSSSSSIQLSPNDGSTSIVSLEHSINPRDKMITIKMINDRGSGWIGIGFSETGKMVPSYSFVGLPNEGIIQEYHMLNRTIDGIVPIAQALFASMSQNATHTVMSFMISLQFSDGTISISTDVPTTIIWAVGADNQFGQHIASGSVSILLNNKCRAYSNMTFPPKSDVPSDGATTIPPSDVVSDSTNSFAPSDVSSNPVTDVSANISASTPPVTLEKTGAPWRYNQGRNLQKTVGDSSHKRYLRQTN